jgi:hypothetical protein
MNKYDELLGVISSLERRLQYLEQKQDEQTKFNWATTSKIRAMTLHLDLELLLSEDGFKFYRAIPNKKLDTESE